MKQAYYFKALQRKLKFRNPDHILSLEQNVKINISQRDLDDARLYVDSLYEHEIQYTYPGHSDYPVAFYKMIEPPLFLEYQGIPCWKHYKTMSVVGARKIDPLTRQWMSSELSDFLHYKSDIALVSGGAEGVDQMAHLLSLKLSRPTIVVLPCGLEKLFPYSLDKLKESFIKCGGCLISEFEHGQSVRKNFFYFRNRLIAAFSQITLVVQAEKKSGSFLTVHHALQNGKTILTVPSHPMMSSFSGNQYLMKEGAFFVSDRQALLDFWEAESWSGPV